VSSTSVEQGAAAKQAADNKTAKYRDLETTHTHAHIFFFLTVMTTGSWSHQTIELVQKQDITKDSSVTTFLFQKLFLASKRETRSHS